MSTPTFSTERLATRVELVFRKLYPPQSVTPQPSEIYLLPGSDRGDLASLVLEKGPDTLRRGTGPCSRIVIDTDAKFDDMLAASILQRLLTGQPVPRGLQEFARYTGLFRAGLRPARFPLENSLEGAFLAIRCHASKPLTDPETSASFLADWVRLAELIFRSAEHGADPVLTPLSDLLRVDSVVHELRRFNAADEHHTEHHLPGVDFSRERAFLIKDLDVYRHDVAHGEKWTVRLPGKAGLAHGLLLRQPQSVLFRYWTRSQCPPPVGGPFSFIAVTFWHGQWVFSTIPGEKVSLEGLAARLQAAEVSKAPQLAAKQPWFDGKPTGYQTIAAPRAGTALTDDAVVKLVRTWCRASIPGRAALRLRNLATVLGACLTVAITLALVLHNTASKAPLKVHDLYVLSVGVSKYQKLGALPFAAKDAEDLQAAFKRLAGTSLCKSVETKRFTNDEATRSNILVAGLGAWLLDQQPLTRHSLVIVTLSGHGVVDKRGNYTFAPHNFDPNDPEATGIFFNDLQRYLKHLPCPAVVVLDTCHSGAAEEDLGKMVSKSMEEGAGRWACMVACDLHQSASETRRWQHGALTLALLECLEGRYLHTNEKLFPVPFPKPGEDGVVFLNEIDSYVNDRVEQLCSELSVSKNRKQRTRTFCTPHITLEQIPFAAMTAR